MAWLQQFGSSEENPLVKILLEAELSPGGSRTACSNAEKITDGEHLNPEFSESGMPIVMAGNVLDEGVDLQNCKTVDVSIGTKFRKKCSPAQGDLAAYVLSMRARRFVLWGQ